MRKLIIGLWVLLFCGSLGGTAAAGEDNLAFYERATNAIPSEQKQRMREIITGVMGDDPTFLSDAAHREFWSIFRAVSDLDGTSDEDFESYMRFIRRAMTGLTTVGMKLFWEDALWARASGRFFKSSMREKVERQYLKQGLISESRVKQNDALIEKISRKEPIATGSGEIIFDEDTIKLALDQVEEAGKRVEWLFSRPVAQ